MNRLTLGLCAVAVAVVALTSVADSDSWAGRSSCSTEERDFAATSSNGSASNADSRAQLSVTVDSRGGTDVSVQLGDPPQEHHKSSFLAHGYDGEHAGCGPQRYRRLGPN